MLPVLWRIVLLLTAILILVGCSRARYRTQADLEASQAVVCATADPRYQVENFDVTPDPRSRMFDPTNLDCPPMPPDDPDSHRLMHCVDCKRGWPCWHCNGSVPAVDNPGWELYLPRSADGEVVLDRRGAVEVALVNSRAYQNQIESLYLAALSVTYQRFRFDTQFFFSNRTEYAASDLGGGGAASSTLSNTAAGSAAGSGPIIGGRLFATGGELLVGLANSVVWQFAGPDSVDVNTALNLSVVQPLLRNAGRAVVLEALTDSERALLANVRQMEQYRRGFYSQVVVGRATGPGPSPTRLTLESLAPAMVTRSVGGFLAILQQQVQIRNQRANISGLKRSLDQLQARYDTGRIRDRFQVDLPRQALYRAQVTLLSSITDYQTRLDDFKVVLGLPPDLKLRVSDPLLARFDLIDPVITRALDQADSFLAVLFNTAQPVPADWRSRLEAEAEEAQSHMQAVERDLRNLNESLPARRRDLADLSGRQELRGEDFETGPYELKTLEHRVARIAEDYRAVVGELKAARESLAGVAAEPERPRPDAPEEDPRRKAWELWRDGVIRMGSRLANVLSDLSLIQARARLESVTLVPVELSEDAAMHSARENRPDWMNARANLVDVWRKIEVAANSLKGELDVRMDGVVGTGHDATRQLKASLEFDAPLTRLVQRNIYREALLNYQQARRSYQSFEDRISANLRNTLRSTRLSQLNFEIRRASVRVAIDQVEITRLRIQQPPRPGETSETVSVGRDLVDALNNLLSAENDFLAGWVDYETLRLNLDYELGTMRLDDRGMWIDPGPIDAGYVLGQGAPSSAEGTPSIEAPSTLPSVPAE